MKKRFKLLALIISSVVLLSAAACVFAAPASAAENIAETVTLPSAYENDRSRLQYSTPIRDQGNTDLCWVFAAVACAESNAIKKGYETKDTADFSEWHLSYFTYNGERTGTGDSVSCNGSYEFYDLGGHTNYAAFAAANGIGFADEEVAPFAVFEKMTNKSLDSSLMYSCSYRLQNYLMLDTDDITSMKQAIYDYGAISIGYYAGESGNEFKYMNTEVDYAYYCPDATKEANHGVAIVGWDDTYSRYNFLEANRPVSNGAWLCKNSWGTDYLDYGYFWLSYEDATIIDAYAYEVAPYNEGGEILAHDGGIAMIGVDNSADEGIANAFTLTERRLLKEVSFTCFMPDTATTATLPATISVYLNPTISDSQPVSNTPVLTKSINVHEGINTWVLDTPYILPSNSKLVLMVNTDASIAFDFTVNSDPDIITTATAEAGQSYLVMQDIWVDTQIFEDYPELGEAINFRIKAYTEPAPINKLTVISPPSLYSMAYKTELSKVKFSTSTAQVINSTGQTVSGRWTLNELNYSSSKASFTFTPSNTIDYEPIKVEVDFTYYAAATSIGELSIMCKTQKNLYTGERVFVTAYWTSSSAVGGGNYTDSIKLYYTVSNDSTKYEITDYIFTVPTDAANKTITIYAEYAGEAGKYDACTSFKQMIVLQAPTDSADNTGGSEQAPSRPDIDSKPSDNVVIDTTENFKDPINRDEATEEDSSSRLPAVLIVGGGIVLLASIVTIVIGVVAVAAIGATAVIATVLVIKKIKKRK